MALATQCPHCNTIFRVASDQLKLHGGIVRCGSCKLTFDGNSALFDTATGQTAPAVPATPAAPATADSAPENSVTSAAEPALSQLAPLKYPFRRRPPDALFTRLIPPRPALGPTPEREPESAPYLEQQPYREQEPERPDAEPTPGPASKSSLAPDFDLDLDFDFDEEPESAKAKSGWVDLDAQAKRTEGDAIPIHDDIGVASVRDGNEAAPLQHDIDAGPPQRDSHDMHDIHDTHVAIVANASDLAQPKIDLFAATVEEPAFVKQSRHRQRTGRAMSILMGLGALLLLLTLLGQGAFTFRSQLAAQLPAVKPALTLLCARLGCSIALPARIEFITIDLGQLQTLGNNTFSLTTMLHNQGRSVQAWPHIELILTDDADQPVLRSVFTARQYLGANEAAAQNTQGFAAQSEQAVKLYFELDQIAASGYHISVFYP
jgi:predicted Zn finger-like uncharacterized protein